jgi:RNA polymerase sigma-70 factor (ECF subfamily)
VDTDRLVEDHKDLVYHLIHRTVRDRTAHEEVFQEVFLNVLESLPRFEGRSKLSTWIASVAIHTCYKFIHRAGRRERAASFGDWLEGGSEPSVPSGLQEDLERTDVRRRLERHLGELAPKHALPITLFYLEGMSYQEIAAILEVPLGTLKCRLFRGLRELRKRIEGGGDGFLRG